jgi:hypothetical protein
MIELSELLGRFKNIILSGELEKGAIQKTLKDILNLELKKEEIKIKNGTVFLNIKPLYKNEILLKKEKIINLHKSFPKSSIIDFR